MMTEARRSQIEDLLLLGEACACCGQDWIHCSDGKSGGLRHRDDCEYMACKGE